MSKNIDNEIDVVIASKTDDNTIIATTTSEQAFKNLLNQAMMEYSTYNIQNKNHIYSRILKNLTIDKVIITEDELDNLATNPQDDIEKIKKINDKIRYYINKDDLIGKVYETIESNINTDIKLNFKDVSKSKRNKFKERQRAEEIINEFNDIINLKSLLRKAIPMTYIEGNYIFYKRKVGDNYIIDRFPLGVAEISPYELDGEPIILININELKSRLINAGYRDKKGKNLFIATIDEEIKNNYPPEVYEAYKNNERYAKLNPENVGVMRINNLNRQYGVSPIFRTFSPQMMLDILSTSDRNNASAKGKNNSSTFKRKVNGGRWR